MLVTRSFYNNSNICKSDMQPAPQQQPPTFSFPVLRTAALEKLTRSAPPSTQISLIAAPTGYGKTVLLSALHTHLSDVGMRAYWVCLNENDDNAERVLNRLESLFFPQEENFSRAADVHKSDEPIEQRIEELRSMLRVSKTPIVLFIDNLDCCRDETLGAILDGLVFQTAGQVYLVLASTKEPAVSFHRARLAGMVSKYGYADLSLDLDNVSELLGAELRDRLGHAGVEKIHRITEGWPAAVRLMQIILDESAAPIEVLDSFSGSDVDLANMLNHLVISGFEQGFREFLLKIAVLKKFSVPLCEHVTEMAASGDYVRRLISDNLLIIPLDRNNSEYRLHSLFREFLLDQGRREMTEATLANVLLRAAAWSEARGDWEDAINYALTAGDYPYAAATLDRVAPSFVRDRGDISRFIDWVEKLEAADCQPGWESDYWYVWALVFHRRYDYAARQLDRLNRRIENAEPSDVDRDELARRLEIIGITVATYTDRLSAVDEKARQWLLLADRDDPFDIATVSCAIGIHYSGNFDFLRAREYFGTAQARISQADSVYGRAWVDVLSSLIDIHEGSFGQCYEKSVAVLQRVRDHSGDSSGMASTAAALAARCAVEVGKDVEASEYLRLSMRRVQTHGLVDTAAFALEAAVKLWASPLGDEITVVELREIASSFPARLNDMLSCYLIQRLLRLGRIDEAREEAARMGINSKRLAGEVHVPLTRFLISQTLLDMDIAAGKIAQSEPLLINEIAQAKREGRSGHLVELALLQMTASLRSPSPEQATRHLTRAVSHAAKRRYFRPFRDRAELIAGLVNETRVRSWGFALPEEKSFFGEICQLLPTANSAIAEHLENLEVESKLLEGLTPRELELLHLIEAGLTNQQLADRLFVSVATVKWHLYNLYNKLSVSNRSGAIAKARALNLIKN